MTYRIETTRAAERDLASLPKSVLKRVDARVLGLETNPRPRGAEKIESGGGLFRVRVGAYRIVYEKLLCETLTEMKRGGMVGRPKQRPCRVGYTWCPGRPCSWSSGMPVRGIEERRLLILLTSRDRIRYIDPNPKLQ